MENKVTPTPSRFSPKENLPHEPPYSLSLHLMRLEAKNSKALGMEEEQKRRNKKEGRKERRAGGRGHASPSCCFVRVT